MCVCVTLVKPCPRGHLLLMLSLSHFLHPVIVNKKKRKFCHTECWCASRPCIFDCMTERSAPAEKNFQAMSTAADGFSWTNTVQPWLAEGKKKTLKSRHVQQMDQNAKGEMKSRVTVSLLWGPFVDLLTNYSWRHIVAAPRHFGF